jgi:hypothetical protein
VRLAFSRSEEAATARREQSLDLNVIRQHQFLGMGVQIRLLVHRPWHRIAVVANPSYKTGHKRQKLLGLATRILIQKPPDVE